MKWINLVLLVLLLSACNNNKPQAKAEENDQSAAETRPLAKFEPSGDQVLLFVGQELEAVGGLEQYNDGYLDHFDKPAGWTTYTNINPGEDSFGRIQEGLDGLYETAGDV